MDHPACERETCIHREESRYSLSSLEKVNSDCLDFEDATDFLRLKADAIKGILA
jgi:hypothetical protein